MECRTEQISEHPCLFSKYGKCTKLGRKWDSCRYEGLLVEPSIVLTHSIVGKEHMERK